MRSIFVKILLWLLGTLAVSLVGFQFTSHVLMRRLPHHEDFFARTHDLLLDVARHDYEEGGPARLARRLQQYNALYHAEHIIVDASGRDLAGGEDRSALLARATWHRGPPEPFEGRLVMGRPSPDGRYRLIVLIPPPFGAWDFSAYYLWIVLVVLAMAAALAVNLARPLRRLRRAVDRFGRGDLSTRVGMTRRDEIGELANAFDRMAERIETLLTAERRLLQDVSHELRSPLARLGFAMELVRTAADRDAALARARKETDRLTLLVDELLQLTREEGDPSDRIFEDVSVRDLLRDLIADCSLEAEAHGCRLDLIVEDPVVVQGQAELLRRAIENIVRNAIRHEPEGGTVVATLSRIGDLAAITVRDHGIGVPDEALGDIFRPFFRVESDRDRASGGVGLGLAIAHRAISLHKGRLTARNASPGLIVTIELPSAQVPDAVPAADGP